MRSNILSNKFHTTVIQKHYQTQPQREVGASMIEFAVVLPLVSLLIFGIVQYGLIFNARVTLKDLAAVSVRHITLSRQNPLTERQINDYIEGLVGLWMPTAYLDPPQVVVTNTGTVQNTTTVNLVYRLPTYIRVPGTDSNGRFVIRVHATMK